MTVPQVNLLFGCLPERRWATVAFLVYSAARDNERQRVEPHHVDLDGTLILPGTKTEGAHREIPLRNHTLAPHGWYMLFLVDRDRTPSTAAWVRVN